jgi:2-polyprenyl-3-methyl-5-hydroxy-6-metoxy-1,4-benzoquinol methylase
MHDAFELKIMNDLAPSQQSELIQSSWEANAAAWTQVVRSKGIESRRVATDIAIVKLIQQYGAKRLLEVGCGEGWLARQLSGQGMEIVGFDGSQELIAHARELREGEFFELSYYQAIANPQLLRGLYDAIVCNFSLLEEKITPLLQVLQNQLSDCGHLFIQTVHPFTAISHQPYVDGWRLELFKSFDTAFSEPMPWYFRTVSSWLNVFKESGLTVVETIEPVHPDTKQPLSLILVCE